jgi:hypothetical protein
MKERCSRLAAERGAPPGPLRTMQLLGRGWRRAFLPVAAHGGPPQARPGHGGVGTTGTAKRRGKQPSSGSGRLDQARSGQSTLAPGTSGSSQQRRSSGAEGGSPLRLSDSQLLRWERNGYIVTRGCLPASDVAALRPEVEAVIDEQKLAALRHR